MRIESRGTTSPPSLVQSTSSPSKSVQSRVTFPPSLVITYLVLCSTFLAWWVVVVLTNTFRLDTGSSFNNTCG